MSDIIKDTKKLLQDEQEKLAQMSETEKIAFCQQRLQSLGLMDALGNLTETGQRVYQAIQFVEESGKPYMHGAPDEYYQK